MQNVVQCHADRLMDTGAGEQTKPEAVHMALRAAVANLFWSASDADRDGEPYHYILLHKDGHCEMKHTVALDKNHQVGRILDAVATASHYLPVSLPEVLRTRLIRLLFESFNYPDCLNRFVDPEEGPKMHPHNLREGLLGLTAVIAGGSPGERQKAEQIARGMLETLDAVSTVDGGLSYDRFTARGIDTGYERETIEIPPPQSTGRLVGALMKYYRVTGDDEALRLAGRFTGDNLRRAFPAGSHFVEETGTHVHSITSALMGLLDWAVTENKDRAVEQLRRHVDDSFTAENIGSSYGWFKEERVIHEFKDRGENTGDVIQAAIHLGRAGLPSYYGMAERYMRSFHLPGQLRSVGRFRENSGAAKDCLRHIRRRLHGGYGFPAPNDRFPGVDDDISVNATDVTAGAVTAMSLFLDHQLTRDNGAHRLNFLFDLDSPELRVRSQLPEKGRLELTARKPIELSVRIPDAVVHDEVDLVVEDRSRPVRIEGKYLRLGRLDASSSARIDFPIERKQTKERVWRLDLEIEWLGETVVAMEPVGERSPMYQADRPPTQVWGRIISTEDGNAENGGPIEGAQVDLCGLDGRVIAGTRSDAAGGYAIDAADLETGTYEVSVSADGFVPTRVEAVRLIGGWPQTVDLSMRPVER